MAEESLEEAHRRFESALNAGDLDTLVALYEPGAQLIPGPGQLASGHAAIRAALEGFLGLRGKIEVTTRYAIRAGDLALLSAAWRLRGTGPDGKPLEVQGKTAEIVRRLADGRWLYVVDHPNGAD
jgi:uncharacterized protein (TIGR02246 family)